MPASVLHLFDSLEETAYVCQPKLDGVRVNVTLDCGCPRMWTRNGMQIEVPYSMRKDLVTALEAFPSGDVTLDGELLGAYGRSDDPALALWDVTHYAGSWIGTWPYRSRFETLLEHVTPGMHSVFLIACEENDFAAYFESLKSVQDLPVEGVVIKALDSKLKGGRQRSAINPDWVKIRFA
jgi:ATP-dependent DNA ligase